ncbi:DJ-1/PfpI family protein [Dissulfurirhabdus thermomarina]|uniref:DJ-1/PfpI family protein n=1 Tax=Dissulfurirhabdus thermomarina TaxID=1765737 RepID=A0A6N9TPN3_DISTH|nr:DJ-1 family glyoxalase III [Dissulfurirhabdus thermomarina]NDY42400.1 DJ-1/PfpI family protein [Dissulfurirhabdus thermomarina]NMX23230.1 DJ-1/PfpI family protein [Dissulfurirhabdus thermomarina]
METTKKRVLLLLAQGFEELEAVTVIDILRRAGVEVVAAGLEPGPVTSARGVVLVPDAALDEVLDRDFDLVVLPGGLEGTDRLAADPRVAELLRRRIHENRPVGAICAAPTVLERHGLAGGRRLTCHPVSRSGIRTGRLVDERVVQDGTVITSQGPGTAMEFAMKLVEYLCGREKVEEVNRGVLARL